MHITNTFNFKNIQNYFFKVYQNIDLLTFIFLFNDDIIFLIYFIIENLGLIELF